MAKTKRKKTIAETMAEAGNLGASAPRVVGVDGAKPVRCLPTGFEDLDAALGIGGLPEGRIAIPHGGDGGGKSSFCLQVAVECQRRGGIVVWLEYEEKFDANYAKHLGVDLDWLIYDEPSHIEDGFAKLQKMLYDARAQDANCPILIVWDSLHASQSKISYEGDYEGYGFAKEPRVFSHNLKKFIDVLSETGAIFLPISQVRLDMNGQSKHPGVLGVGKSVRHHATTVMEFRNPKMDLKAKDPGMDIPIYIQKNQVAPPFRTADLRMTLGHGFDKIRSLIRQATHEELIRKNGAWFEVDVGNKAEKAHGETQLVELLRSNEDVAFKLREKLRANYPEEVGG